MNYEAHTGYQSDDNRFRECLRAITHGDACLSQSFDFQKVYALYFKSLEDKSVKDPYKSCFKYILLECAQNIGSTWNYWKTETKINEACRIVLGDHHEGYNDWFRVNEWLEDFETEKILVPIPTYPRQNFPQFYFSDTGFAAFLLNFDSRFDHRNGYLRSPVLYTQLFRNLVISRLIQEFFCKGIDILPKIFAWQELSVLPQIDCLILERSWGTLESIEIYSTALGALPYKPNAIATPNKNSFNTLALESTFCQFKDKKGTYESPGIKKQMFDYWLCLNDDTRSRYISGELLKTIKNWVIYDGDDNFVTVDNKYCISWKSLSTIIDPLFP